MHNPTDGLLKSVMKEINPTNLRYKYKQNIRKCKKAKKVQLKCYFAFFKKFFLILFFFFYCEIYLIYS